MQGFNRSQDMSLSGKVVQMDRFRDGRSLSPLRQAEAYWAALREGSGIPQRSQIDPRGLENILEYTFILERIAPGVARFRLAGQHLAGLAGMEVRGMPLTAFFVGRARSEISAVLEHVFSSPSVAELSLSGKQFRLGPRVEARMILLPLESDLGDVNRALGVLVTSPPVLSKPDKPMRFDRVDFSLRPADGPLDEAPAAPRAADPETADPETAGDTSPRHSARPAPMPAPAESGRADPVPQDQGASGPAPSRAKPTAPVDPTAPRPYLRLVKD